MSQENQKIYKIQQIAKTDCERQQGNITDVYYMPFINIDESPPKTTCAKIPLEKIEVENVTFQHADS